MSNVALSSASNRAAVKVVTVVTKSVGLNIAAYAAYMTSARADGLTVAALNRELIALDVDGNLPSRAMLGIWAQAADLGDKLAMNTAADYALAYVAISRIRRVKGYDLDATIAPIVGMEDRDDKRDALSAIGTPNGLPIITREGSPAPSNDDDATDSVADSATDSAPTEESSLVDDLVKTITRTANAIKGATFTPEEYARLAVALNALGVAATKAKPGK